MIDPHASHIVNLVQEKSITAEEGLSRIKKDQDVRNFLPWFQRFCRVANLRRKFLGKLLSTLSGSQLQFMEDSLVGLFSEAWTIKLSENSPVKDTTH